MNNENGNGSQNSSKSGQISEYVSNGKVTARQQLIANFFGSANFFPPLHTVPARFLDDFERSAGLYLSLVCEIFVKAE